MNVVIYTTQLEPVTVVDIPCDFYQRLWARERIRLCVPPKDMLRPYDPAKEPINWRIETISIWGERFKRKEHEGLLCFVDEWDETNALAVRSSFLPGQIAEVRHRESVAVMRVLLAGFDWGSL